MCDMIDKWWFQTIRKKHLFHRTIRQIPMNPPGTPNKKKPGDIGSKMSLHSKSHRLCYTQRLITWILFTEMPQSAIHPPCHWHACGRSTILWWSPAGEMESLRLGAFIDVILEQQMERFVETFVTFFLHDSLFMGIVLDWMDFIYNIYLYKDICIYINNFIKPTCWRNIVVQWDTTSIYSSGEANRSGLFFIIGHPAMRWIRARFWPWKRSQKCPCCMCKTNWANLHICKIFINILISL